jgi:hypothetical protein
MLVQRKVIDKIHDHKRRLPIRLVNRLVIEARRGKDLISLIRESADRLTDLSLWILSWSGLRWLWGVPGPHMYVVLQREDAGDQ